MYHPETQWLFIRIPGDVNTRRLFGGWMVGDRQAKVSKRIDVPATAAYHEARVNELADPGSLVHTASP
ncbi:hypothetical protein ACFL0Q_04045 [Thermodesulfobacteriota bacterium]